MTISIDNHVEDKGVSPSVQILNWTHYVSVRVWVGELKVTSYIYPHAGETTEDLIERIVADFGAPVVDYPHDDPRRAELKSV